MKKLTKLTISSILTAAILLSAGGLTAFAADGSAVQTNYPASFSPSVIRDYAVNGNLFAIATDKKIAVYGGEKPDYKKFDYEIAAVDVYGDSFCYKTAGGVVYDFNGNSLDHKITETVLPVATNGYSYTIKPDNTIKTTDKDGNDAIVEGNFSNLKLFGNTVYAINGNVLNKIVPPDKTEEILYGVEDFSAVYEIKVGDTVNALDNYNAEKPHLTALKDGEYLTEVKLDSKNFNKSQIKPTECFNVDETFKVGERSGFSNGDSALVLCKTGNAHIIAFKNKFYLRLAEGKDEIPVTPAAPDFESAIINIPSDYVYSSPCISDATKAFSVNWGASIKVLGKITKTDMPVLSADFYLIELVDESGAKHTGYVPCTFVFEKVEQNDVNKTDDPDPKTDNKVKTVVLVIIVIVLVLTAVGYVTFVFTSDKKRKKK